jgi:hypothetical protein
MQGQFSCVEFYGAWLSIPVLFLRSGDSVASGPFLAVLVTLEALSAYLSVKKTISKTKRRARGFAAGSAIGSELLIKKNYHRHCLKHFWQRQRYGQCF